MKVEWKQRLRKHHRIIDNFQDSKVTTGKIRLVLSSAQVSTSGKFVWPGELPILSDPQTIKCDFKHKFSMFNSE